jgi:hypothetical protein
MRKSTTLEARSNLVNRLGFVVAVTRAEYGLSEDEFARLAGVDCSTMKRLELAGECPPSLEVKVAFAVAALDAYWPFADEFMDQLRPAGVAGSIAVVIEGPWAGER